MVIALPFNARFSLSTNLPPNYENRKNHIQFLPFCPPSYCFSRQIPIAPSAPITPHQPLLLTDNFTKFDACLYTRAHVYLSGVPKGYINMHSFNIRWGAWPCRLCVLCCVRGSSSFLFFYQLDLCNNTISLSGLALRAVNL